jgi:hypothetical protein
MQPNPNSFLVAFTDLPAFHEPHERPHTVVNIEKATVHHFAGDI